jgi:seryl-tRNA synthetase
LGTLGGVIDVNELRANPDKYRTSQRARRADESLVEEIISADAARREAVTRHENLRADQNAFGKKVAQAKGEEKQALLAEVKELAADVKKAAALADEARARQEDLVRRLPNLIEDGVPEGGERTSRYCAPSDRRGTSPPKASSPATTWRSVS